MRRSRRVSEERGTRGEVGKTFGRDCAGSGDPRTTGWRWFLDVDANSIFYSKIPRYWALARYCVAENYFLAAQTDSPSTTATSVVAISRVRRVNRHLRWRIQGIAVRLSENVSRTKNGIANRCVELLGLGGVNGNPQYSTHDSKIYQPSPMFLAQADTTFASLLQTMRSFPMHGQHCHTYVLEMPHAISSWQ
jgi:hypothetical protein